MKKFEKKTDVTRKIRDAFREGMSTSELSFVKEFVDSIKKEYELKPETLAFIIQKINAFQLFQTFKENNNSQVYPKITLINVIDFCKDYGYDNIYRTINNNLLSKMDINSGTIQKEASFTSKLREYNMLNKAASKNQGIKESLSKDEDKNCFSKFANSRLKYDLKNLKEAYWSLIGIEKFIKKAYLDTDPKLSKLLDLVRNNRINGVISKKANLDTFLEFKNTLVKFKKEASLLGLLD